MRNAKLLSALANQIGNDAVRAEARQQQRHLPQTCPTRLIENRWPGQRSVIARSSSRDGRLTFQAVTPLPRPMNEAIDASRPGSDSNESCWVTFAVVALLLASLASTASFPIWLASALKSLAFASHWARNAGRSSSGPGHGMKMALSGVPRLLAALRSDAVDVKDALRRDCDLNPVHLRSHHCNC